MVLGGNDQEILNEIIKQQKVDNKRIERLETLEFHKASLGIGCIEWLAYVHPQNVANISILVPAPVGTVYSWTHLTMFWHLVSSTAGMKNLYMTINGIITNYGYTYKYAQGGAQTIISADGQTQIIVGRIPQSPRALGWIQFPFYSDSDDMGGYGDWVAYDGSQPSGSRVERGEWGGMTTWAGRPFAFTFSASAGNITGWIYLYGWCPTWTVGQGPPD